MHVYMGPGGKRTVYAALADGLGCPLVEAAAHRGHLLLPGAVAMYGAARLWPILTRARAEGRTWLYADNGYFKPGHWAGHFSLTRDAYQLGHATGAPPATDHDRWAALGLAIAPWRRHGGHVLVCPPTPVWSALIGLDDTAWLRTTLTTLKAATDRPIRVRHKPRNRARAAAQGPLADDLKDCWALVTHSSKAAIEALLAGVPAFCTHPCAASPVALADVTRIEQPNRDGDRHAWAAWLAAGQWTIEEIRRGLFRERLGL